MTPGARVQAAIDILDLIIAAARNQGPSADRIIGDWFRTRRFAGSGDRRAVRDLTYRAIRDCGEIPADGRSAMLGVARGDSALAELFDGSGHAPVPIDPNELVAPRGIAPDWLLAALSASGIAGKAAAALLARAPLDIRVNALKSGRETLVLPVAGQVLAAPNGLRLLPGTPVESWDVFRDGLIEVQDGGSQLVCEAVAASPGETVIDLCAGAGGKTLALAAAMAGSGELVAADTDRARLARLVPRAVRAGATPRAILLDPGKELVALGKWVARADAVLVDAPCSGTGTWRRNPEARWRVTPRELARVAVLQARLLDIGAALLRPGGRLIYVTCSLLDAEGADQAAAFLARHPGWRAEPVSVGAGTSRGCGLRLEPWRDATDGFFVARLIAP